MYIWHRIYYCAFAHTYRYPVKYSSNDQAECLSQSPKLKDGIEFNTLIIKLHFLAMLNTLEEISCQYRQFLFPSNEYHIVSLKRRGTDLVCFCETCMGRVARTVDLSVFFIILQKLDIL